MKIRCGSHQQNRSIVRPGLSLMATKVALTAEEFRENSQRSIALFNTEKLSTNSTHVLKSAYCNSVHFCSCNLHGACGGKAFSGSYIFRKSRCNLHGACGGKVSFQRQGANQSTLQSARGVWRQSSGNKNLEECKHRVAICTGRVEAKDLPVAHAVNSRVAICTGRVEAKDPATFSVSREDWLQSARGVWRQRTDISDHGYRFFGCNLHGACGGKEFRVVHHPSSPQLQSARGVWRQRRMFAIPYRAITVAICTGRVEAKSTISDHILMRLPLQSARGVWRQRPSTKASLPCWSLQSARGVWRQSSGSMEMPRRSRLQSARGVWRQRDIWGILLPPYNVAICTGRVEAKRHRRQPLALGEGCNLHGACGGKGRVIIFNRKQ